MALNDEVREQRKLLKGKGPGAYFQYFWDYYRWPTVGVIGGIILVGSLVFNFVMAKPDALHAVLLNCESPDLEAGMKLESEFAEAASIDTRREAVSIETGYNMTTGSMLGQYDMATQVKMMALTGAGDLDLLVADAYHFDEYITGGGLLDLREVLDEAQVEQLEKEGLIWYYDPSLIRVEGETMPSNEFISAEEGAAFENPETFTLPDPGQMEEPVPAGIILTGRPVFERFWMYTDTVVAAGFPNGSKRLENARKLLDYLMSEEAGKEKDPV